MRCRVARTSLELPMNLQKARNLYVATAIFICNLLVIFVAINLAIAGYQLLKSASRSTKPLPKP